MAVAARLFQTEEPSFSVAPASRLELALAAAAAMQHRLRCRWEYNPAQRRLIQSWELLAE